MTDQNNLEVMGERPNKGAPLSPKEATELKNRVKDNYLSMFGFDTASKEEKQRDNELQRTKVFLTTTQQERDADAKKRGEEPPKPEKAKAVDPETNEVELNPKYIKLLEDLFEFQKMKEPFIIHPLEKVGGEPIQRTAKITAITDRNNPNKEFPDLMKDLKAGKIEPDDIVVQTDIPMDQNSTDPNVLNDLSCQIPSEQLLNGGMSQFLERFVNMAMFAHAEHNRINEQKRVAEQVVESRQGDDQVAQSEAAAEEPVDEYQAANYGLQKIGRNANSFNDIPNPATPDIVTFRCNEGDVWGQLNINAVPVDAPSEIPEDQFTEDYPNG